MTNETTPKEEGKITTNGNGKALIAGSLFVAGGLAGALLGILYAPKRGKETREEIRHSAEELVKKAKNQYLEACQRIGNLGGLSERIRHREKRETEEGIGGRSANL